MNLFLIKSEFFDAFLDDLELVIFVINNKVGLQLNGSAVLTEDPKTGGMKSADPNALSDELFDPRTHLGRGFIRKGHAENIKSGHAVFDEPGNAMCEDPRLPASRASKDEKGPLRHPGYRFALRGIKLG
jgi:hypothetical protein